MLENKVVGQEEYNNGRQRPKNLEMTPRTPSKRKSGFQETLKQLPSEQLGIGSGVSETEAETHSSPRKDTFKDKLAKYESNCKVLEQTPGVLKAYFGYPPDDPKRIIYHCITKNNNVSKNKKLGLEVKYKTIDEHNKEDEDMVDKERECKQERECKHQEDPKYKTIDEHNKEDEDMVDKERECKQERECKHQEDLKNIKNIKNEILVEEDDLKKKHSNLIRVSAGSYKSVGYGTDHEVNKTPCIVFLVKSKGIIPLGENPLPPTIGKYPTDVREAYFYRKVSEGPKDFHRSIRIGCEIGTKYKCGTIGLFVDKRNIGTFGLTCAHVCLDESELKKVKENPCFLPERECHQPIPKRRKHYKCGLLTKVKFTKELDVAFFCIDTSRKPDRGHFPYYANEDLPPNLHFSSGETLERGDIKKDMTVFKYGKETQVTKGVITETDISVPMEDDEMTNLFQVDSSNSEPFSVSGDSGSLIFTKDRNNNIKGVGILVGGHERTDYAMPLSAVISRSSFGNCIPTTFGTN